VQLGTDDSSARVGHVGHAGQPGAGAPHAGQPGAGAPHAGQPGAGAPHAGQPGGAGALDLAVSGVEGAPVVEDVLVEDVSIDGMCGVY
jgi:mycofactocin precursor